MSSKEIIAILIPTGILALVWVIFESAVLKVVKKKGKSSDNKGKTEINLKKENSTDSIDSNIKTGKKIVESKQAFQKTQSAVIENKDLEPDAEKEEHMIEEEFYELAYEEIESGNLKKGLWAKAFSEAEGDENKTKALYIKYRFDQIKEGHKEIEQEEEEVKIDSKLESEKKIVESKIESNNLHIKALLSAYDFEKQEEDVGIDSKIKPEKKIIEPKKESQDEFINRLKGQPELSSQAEFLKRLKGPSKKESQEDIDRRQAEAYIDFHKK